MPRSTTAPRWAALFLALPLAAHADIPSPERDACRGAEPGTPCMYPGPNGPMAGQCVPQTCRTPGAYGTEYPCTYCAAAPTAALEASTTVTPIAAPAEVSGASSEPENRGMSSLLIGVVVVAAGVLALVTRRRS